MYTILSGIYMHETSAHFINSTLVQEAERLDVADKHFGIHFPITIEPMIFQFASQLSPSYTGGYWHFYTLTNGGFFMAPDIDERFDVIADNGYSGKLSAEALGITACLYAFSNLSFGEGVFAETCAEHYHQLLDFAVMHPEAGEIRAAID